MKKLLLLLLLFPGLIGCSTTARFKKNIASWIEESEVGVVAYFTIYA